MLECDNYHDTSRNVKLVIYRDEDEIDNKFYIEFAIQGLRGMLGTATLLE